MDAIKDIYWDGRHYDLQHAYMIDDIPFYETYAETCGGPVLELGCGTGRVTIPLARRSSDITGIDNSLPMLIRAREKATAAGVSIKWIRADIRQFPLKKKSNLILFPFGSIWHLIEDGDVEACFSCVHKHLAPGGRFIIDSFHPNAVNSRGEASREKAIFHYPDPDSGKTITVKETKSPDGNDTIRHITWHYEMEGKRLFSRGFRLRIFSPEELTKKIHKSGFTIEAVYGDYQKNPFESHSLIQLMICRKT
jgi:SAM-dependent methyltransferase